MRSLFLLLLLSLTVRSEINMKKASSKLVKQHLTVQESAASMAVGTNFVYSYINSHLVPTDTSYTENLFLTITNPGTTDASVSISSVFRGFQNQTVVVAAGISTAFSILPPDIQVDYMDKDLDKALFEYKSIWVSSTVPVSLVATNQLSDFSSEDKFAILPICQLGTAYKAVVDDSSGSNFRQPTNIVTVIATEDDTEVSVSPSIPGSHILDKGEQITIAVTFSTLGADIKANKPVAAFSGAVCGYGYAENSIHCSHEALMLTPLSSFGTVYPTFKFQPQIKGELLLFITEDDTQLTFDGEKWPVKVSTDIYFVLSTDDGSLIEGDKPIYVAQSGSANYMDQGAPFFVHVPSPNLFTVGPVTFATALTTDEAINMVHFARIVTDATSIGKISIDNYTPNALIYRRMGRGTYYYVDVSIQIGGHTVSSNGNVQFAVTVYGYGKLRSYGFTPGLNLPTNGAC